MILLVVIAVLAVAVAMRVSLVALRRHRMAAELRGDWWPRFEREFRAYANRGWQAARDSERRD